VEAYGSSSVAMSLPEHLRCMLPPPGLLDEDQLTEVVHLILEFQDLFTGPDGKVGHTHRVSHKINTEDAIPIKSHPRRKSWHEKEAIEGEVRKMLENGQIIPSKSPWGAPVVLVKKKDGSLRFCIDFRRLNEVTKKDAYPLPRIEECLDALNGSKYFSTMDLTSGYWQVAMDRNDREKTAFTTHMGLYEWRVMPFGLCNAPATFMRLMEMVLADIVWCQCLVYLDDIVAFGDSFEKAWINLKAVFIRLRAANLKLKPKKCEFFRAEVEYLGHEVSRDGVRPSPGKVAALHDWVAPKSLSEVRTFLGFAGYYRRFVKDYSQTALPLTALTKKNVCFTWGPSEEAAYQSLRHALMEVPLLHYVRPDLPFFLDTDASGYAIGAVLSQRDGDEEYPLAFASKTLTDSKQRYCTTKRELYAVVYFMRYFQGYTKGQMVYIRTDHGSLTWLMNFTVGDAMYHRWLFELQGYLPWEISHRPGVQHANADALSRIYRDCKIEHCIDCQRRFRKERRCKDDFSDDDEKKKPDDDKDDDRPDDHDYALWDLLLTRTEAHDSTYAVTRSTKPRHRNEHRQDMGPKRRSRRLAAKEVHAAAMKYESEVIAAKRLIAKEAASRGPPKSVAPAPLPVVGKQLTSREQRRRHRGIVRRNKHRWTRRKQRRVAKAEEMSHHQETPNPAKRNCLR